MGDDGKMKRALGVMSGTSMDGIDVALVRTDGQMQVERGPAMSFAYTDDQRAMLRQAISDAKLCKRPGDRPGRLAETERELTELNGAAVSAFLRKQGIDRETIDVIGFHGQTVAHRPDAGMTIQLGDGRFLAELVRCPVVYDLRTNDMANGGQGAPLVPVYHQALLDSTVARPVAVLNIGGVANVTWIDDDADLMAFDTGPGNALIDDWMHARTGVAFDDGGKLAATGRIDDAALKALLDHAYFDAMPPKSLDRNDFSAQPIEHLLPSDGAATLTKFTAASVARAASFFSRPVKTWIVIGGGRHNQTLMRQLRAQFGEAVIAGDAIGLNGDSVEAEAWGYLAVRAELGLPITFPGTTGVSEPKTGGVFVPWPPISNI